MILIFGLKFGPPKEAVKASGLGIRSNLTELNTQCHASKMAGFVVIPLLALFAYQNIQLHACNVDDGLVKLN